MPEPEPRRPRAGRGGLTPVLCPQDAEVPPEPSSASPSVCPWAPSSTARTTRVRRALGLLLGDREGGTGAGRGYVGPKRSSPLPLNAGSGRDLMN